MVSPDIVLPYLASSVWPIVKAWWWFFAPIILIFPLKNLYLYRARWEIWYRKIHWILLEVKPPEIILKPFKAMEDVFSLLWLVYDGANWRERWCEGQPIKGPYWISFEIASIGGQIHFYLWIDKGVRNLVESTIYSQYPDCEISEVEDYTKLVPRDLPNKDYDVLGEDYRLAKPDAWPIMTYTQFFEEQPNVNMEEKRIDPIDSLMEAMSKVQPGGQVWFQLVAAPILNKDIPWMDEGRVICAKLARRPGKPKAPSFASQLGGALQTLATGEVVKDPNAKPQKEKALPLAASEDMEREMLLTPGEKFDLNVVEKKMSKRAFKVWMRAVYVWKRDSFVPGHHKMVRTYIGHFAGSSNFFLYWGGTRTKIHYWFRKKRLELRKKKLFQNYIRRLPPLYPRMESEPMFPVGWCKGKGTMILNTEELASIYHLPAKVGSGIISSLRPIEAKKGGPPAGLPVQEENSKSQ